MSGATGLVTCCCDPVVCPFCDCSPQSFTVAISGLTACNTCISCNQSGIQNSMDNISISISSPFVIVHGPPCIWRNDNIGTISYRLYSSSTDCTGDFVDHSNTMEARLTAIDANNVAFSIFTDPIASPIASVFAAAQVTGGDCASLSPMANAVTSCTLDTCVGVGFFPSNGDGTATFSQTTCP